MTKRCILPFFIPPSACVPDCTFCHETAGRSAEFDRRPELDVVAQQITAATSNAAPGGIEVAFYGGLLCLDEAEWKRFLHAADPKSHTDRIRSIRVAARPDQLDHATVNALSRAGVRRVELDVPTLSATVLRQMGPAHSPSSLQDSIRLLEDSRVEWGVRIRPGLPGSDFAEELSSARELIPLKPRFVRICPTLVIKGTWLEQHYQHGHYMPLTLDEALRICRMLVDNFAEAGIPVIRVGLQPTRDLGLRPGSIVGGPYHPSFRTLVEADRMFDRAAELLRQQISPGRHVILRVSQAVESNLRGPENCNLERLRRRFHLGSLSVSVDAALDRETIRVEYSSTRTQGRQRFAS